MFFFLFDNHLDILKKAIILIILIVKIKYRDMKEKKEIDLEKNKIKKLIYYN